MALTKYVKHYQGFDDNGTQSATTTSFTPENNSLLVALIFHQLDNLGVGTTLSQTVSGGGLTWNLIDEYDIVDGYEVKAYAYYAEVGSASSMTFTFDSNDSDAITGTSIIIYNFTGYDTSTPIGGYYVTGGDARSGAYNGTLSATPALSSYIVAGTIIDEGTLTTGTGWTNDQSDTTYSYLIEEFQSRTNWASSTVAWNAITTSWTWASAAVEVRAAPEMSATNLLNYQASPGSSPISITTTGFTPSNDVMLVAVVGFSDTNSSNHTNNTTLTSTGGVTWTKVSGTTMNLGPVSGLYLSSEIYVAEIGTSPGSITATHTRTGTRGSASCTVNIHIHEVSGSTNGYTTGETMAEEDTAQDGAVNGTLSGTPAGNSVVIGARVADASSATTLTADPGSGWFELSDWANNHYWCSMECQAMFNLTSSTVPWTDVAIGNTIDAMSELVGVEILAIQSVGYSFGIIY